MWELLIRIGYFIRFFSVWKDTILKEWIWDLQGIMDNLQEYLILCILFVSVLLNSALNIKGWWLWSHYLCQFDMSIIPWVLLWVRISLHFVGKLSLCKTCLTFLSHIKTFHATLLPDNWYPPANNCHSFRDHFRNLRFGSVQCKMPLLTTDSHHQSFVWSHEIGEMHKPRSWPPWMFHWCYTLAWRRMQWETKMSNHCAHWRNQGISALP